MNDEKWRHEVRRDSERLQGRRARTSFAAGPVRFSWHPVGDLPGAVDGGAYLGRWLDGLSEGYSVRWTINLIILGLALGVVQCLCLHPEVLVMEALSVIFSIGPFRHYPHGCDDLGASCWFSVSAAGWRPAALSIEQPGLMQTALEGVVQAIESAIEGVLPGRAELLLPFVGTLWLFVAVANLTGLIPGLHAPTGDLFTTAALAILVFLSVHWYGIRSAGPAGYLRHYLSPSPILLPFHILGEFSRTLALAVRLFGNIMSLEMAALLVLLVAGLLVPVPVLMLHVIEALVQAYIFGMLALIYIAGGMQSQLPKNPLMRHHERKKGNTT